MGSEVAFVTTAVSNLINPAETNTPALQVAVRNLTTHKHDSSACVWVLRLNLCQRRKANRAMARFTRGWEARLLPSVHLRRMGNMGNTSARRLDQRRRLDRRLDGRRHRRAGADAAGERGARGTQSRCGGASCPARKRRHERVTGGSDPANPACLASGETILPASASLSDPCQGPFATPEGPIPSGIWAGDGPNPVTSCRV